MHAYIASLNHVDIAFNVYCTGIKTHTLGSKVTISLAVFLIAIHYHYDISMSRYFCAIMKEGGTLVQRVL